ncbi:MAG: Methionyl-tRNA formyltransferase [uncultured Thermomicrobiales bacterium]|uniref:Methionyl-tRNA formyltransferase n=1 Tax=uncultured Thermomicrobiales bacterium TaxID=1645740 RepID=A0A6J4V669_9BACT|nr:MAG: Methionyl-tRNA formyltransferase [uncultured Thermomicrobiales bacterium]
MPPAREEPSPSASWRVVVFTVIPGGFVYRLAEAVLAPMGHRIVGVVTTPGPQRRRSPAYLDVVAAARPSVDVLVSNHPERWAAMLVPLAPDLIVCGGFPWRIPPEVLALPRLGAINLHDALLPRGRGPNASGWAFRNGDAETGFTIHRLTPAFDAGPILAQARVPITDDDDIETLLAQFEAVIPDLLRTALERVARGEEGEPQDEAHATEAGLFEEAWRTIDWGQPTRAIHNQVRSWIGLRDIPRGAVGMVDGQALQITKTRLLPSGEGAPAVPPGTVVARSDDSIVVRCGDGLLEIVAWSPLPAAGAATAP